MVEEPFDVILFKDYEDPSMYNRFSSYLGQFVASGVHTKTGISFDEFMKMDMMKVISILKISKFMDDKTEQILAEMKEKEGEDNV